MPLATVGILPTINVSGAPRQRPPQTRKSSPPLTGVSRTPQAPWQAERQPYSLVGCSGESWPGPLGGGSTMGRELLPLSCQHVSRMGYSLPWKSAWNE